MLDDFWQIFVLIPIMGFCQLSLFGGYAVYFPELFPTRLRSTGTSFCYNVGRLVAAAGPSVLGLLTSRVFSGYHEPMRYAGVAMCSVFFLGLLALPFCRQRAARRCRSEDIGALAKSLSEPPLFPPFARGEGDFSPPCEGGVTGIPGTPHHTYSSELSMVSPELCGVLGIMGPTAPRNSRLHRAHGEAV